MYGGTILSTVASTLLTSPPYRYSFDTKVWKLCKFKLPIGLDGHTFHISSAGDVMYMIGGNIFPAPYTSFIANPLIFEYNLSTNNHN